CQGAKPFLFCRYRRYPGGKTDPSSSPCVSGWTFIFRDEWRSHKRARGETELGSHKKRGASAKRNDRHPGGYSPCASISDAGSKITKARGSGRVRLVRCIRGDTKAGRRNR